MVKRISKKDWYLKSGYSKTEFNNILDRIRELLGNIMWDDDISHKSFKRLGRIRRMLIELTAIDIEEDD